MRSVSPSWEVVQPPPRSLIRVTLAVNWRSFTCSSVSRAVRNAFSAVITFT